MIKIRKGDRLKSVKLTQWNWEGGSRKQYEVSCYYPGNRHRMFDEVSYRSRFMAVLNFLYASFYVQAH